jgi:hypothetical protein
MPPQYIAASYYICSNDRRFVEAQAKDHTAIVAKIPYLNRPPHKRGSPGSPYLPP